MEELVWLLEDAAALQNGGERPRPHPELLGVRTWDELIRLAEYSPPVRTLVDLLSAGLAATLADYLRRNQVPEREALLVVSTAHKAKGREWDRVVLWNDFYPWWEGRGEPDPEEENPTYVAVTRARRHLSLRHLPTLAELLEAPPAPPPNPVPQDPLRGWIVEAAAPLIQVTQDFSFPEEVRCQARNLLKALPRVLKEGKEDV